MTMHPAARDSDAANIDSASLASAIHTLCDQGLAHEALQVARYLVVKSPELAVVQTAYGRALFETGETMTASEILSRTAVQFPYAVAAHRWLAECLLQQGGTARARAVVEKAIGLAPNNPRIRELANLTHVLDNAPLAPGAWLQDVMADDETTARVFSIQTRARVDVRQPIGNDDPTVIGSPPTKPSHTSPLTARNPRPRTSEFDAVEATATDELPAVPESHRVPSATWPKTTRWAERVWKVGALLLLGMLAAGAAWALWLARRTPPPAVQTSQVPAAPSTAPRVRSLPAPSDRSPENPKSSSPENRDRLASEARQRGDRGVALQLARQSLNDGLATAETGLLLANLGELAQARVVLAKLSASRPTADISWLRVAVDLGAGAPHGNIPDHAASPEAILVAARARFREGGPKRLASYLGELQPSHIDADVDLRSFRLLAQFGAGKAGPRYAVNLQRQADSATPVAAFVAGWLAGDQRRLSTFWFSRALTGHGDRCLATRLYMQRMKMLHLRVPRSVVEEQTAAGCSRL